MRFVLDARSAARPSGFATYIRAVGSRIAASPDRSAELRVWTGASGEPMFAGPNVTHHPVHSGAASVGSLLWPTRFDALHPDDVFHAPSNLLGFGLPRRTIVTLHDILWLTHPQWCHPNRWVRPISRAYATAGIRHALRAATRILTVSQASADTIYEHAPQARGRVVVVHNAADPEFRPPSSPADAREQAARLLGFDAPYFLVVGLNQVSKGHAHALEGFAALPRSSARLVFVQRASKGSALQHQAQRLGVADRVSFLGALPGAAILPIMQSALALVHPSLWEGFGLPPLEAMSAGCPVIGSDIPALREVLAGAGLLVPPASPLALRDAMRRIYDEPALRNELRERGLERARAFSWDKAAAETLAVYRDVAR